GPVRGTWGAGDPDRRSRSERPAGARPGTARAPALLLPRRTSVQPLRHRSRGAAAPRGARGSQRDDALAPGGGAMSPFAWVAAGVLVGLILWLGLAVAGAARAIDALRERVGALEARGSPSRALLPVGSLAPVWRIATADGEVVSSSTFDGRR